MAEFDFSEGEWYATFFSFLFYSWFIPRIPYKQKEVEVEYNPSATLDTQFHAQDGAIFR